MQNLRVAASAAVDSAREEIDRQAAGHSRRSISWGAMALHDRRWAGNVETDGTSIGLELAVPIFSRGAVVSQTREAAERHQQAIEQREQARRETYRRTREAFLGVMAGISRVKALKQVVESSPASSQWPLQRPGWVGTRTAVDVVVSERALFGTRRDYTRARYDYPLDMRLKSAAGTLTTGDLAAANGFLER